MRFEFGFKLKIQTLLAASLVVFCFLSPAATAQTLSELPALSVENFEPDIRAQIGKAYADAKSKPRDAQASGWLGMTLHTYEQFDFAEVCYERAHRLAPAEFRWVYYLGIVQAALGKQQEAATAFKTALKLDPNHLPAQLRLADALLSSGQFAESGRLYETIVKRNANIAQAHYGLGRVASAGGNTTEAGARYRKAIEAFPEYGAAHYALGLVLRDQNQTKESQEHLARSQQLKLSQPTLEDPLIISIAEMNAGASAHLKRGVALESAGRLSESIAEHERALEINPWLVQAHINLISLYGRAGQNEKAEKHYRAALNVNPDLPEIHYNHGVLLVGQERLKEAAQAFEQCLKLNPYYAEAHHNFATLIESEGRLDEAAAHYRKAIENKPGYRPAHFQLGRILVNQDKLREAIEQFQKTLTPEDEQTPLFAYALGATYIRAGEREKGIQYLRQALKRAKEFGQTQLAASIERDLQTLEKQS